MERQSNEDINRDAKETRHPRRFSLSPHKVLSVSSHPNLRLVFSLSIDWTIPISRVCLEKTENWKFEKASIRRYRIVWHVMILKCRITTFLGALAVSRHSEHLNRCEKTKIDILDSTIRSVFTLSYRQFFTPILHRKYLGKQIEWEDAFVMFESG